ncbi:gas vesicle protein GvpJ [Halosolutus amylolyticus]|uniref:Gas vesicle protein GvpJ n=1 Tax=Halosolutus amylolyticus TaxID=2932267 RepID=A0ABD5PMB2_9EURY|nr:gas vesicle protein [Halosolutus amylolyticus]
MSAVPHDFQPSRQKTDLADVIEMLLDKGIVINADIAVSIGDTQLLGVQIRAAIASFETAAKYGLEFPEGTDMRRLAAAVGEPELAEMERPNPVIDPTRGVNVTPNPEEGGDDESGDGGEGDDESGSLDIEEDRVSERVGKRPDPERPTSGGFDLLSDDADDDGEDAADDEAGSDEGGTEDEAEAAPETEES